MRYYTKEWYELMQALGTSEMFEPIIEKEYSDEEFEQLYCEMLEKHIQEERDLYDEPPVFDLDEWKEEFPREEFDPEYFLIGEIDEDGEEYDLRNPESYEELLQFQIDEYEHQWKEFEERPPFDEEEAREEFEDDYNESLEEPDEDIPAWIRESVDPRLIALGLLPERVYKKLLDEEEEMERRFDELDEIADMEYESLYEDLLEGDEDAAAELPEGIDYDELIRNIEDLNAVDGDYVAEVRILDGDLVIVFSGWDEEGDEIVRTAFFENAEILEDDGLEITTERDEDGDIVSDCDFTAHELYCLDDGKYEVHMLFENKGLKYLTFRCDFISFEQQSADD